MRLMAALISSVRVRCLERLRWKLGYISVLWGHVIVIAIGVCRRAGWGSEPWRSCIRICLVTCINALLWKLALRRQYRTVHYGCMHTVLSILSRARVICIRNMVAFVVHRLEFLGRGQLRPFLAGLALFPFVRAWNVHFEFLLGW